MCEVWSLFKYWRNWHIYEHYNTKSFKINHKVDCLFYLLIWKSWENQYVGETTDEFCFRWNNCKSIDRKNARNEACMQEHLFEHFKSEYHNGFLGNDSITLIDKIDGKDSRRRENYWMQTLKTYAPFGLNIGDSVWPIPHRNVNVTGGLTVLIFFGRLVWPSTDLGQNFSGMIFIFMLHATFTLYAIIVFIAWFKLLYWLLIYYSYLYYC